MGSRYSPNNPAYLDSLGWVHLRLGEFSDSIRDFNAALKRIPKQASSLYGRGIAELRLNKRATGEADIAAATAAPAAAVEELRRYHLAP